MTYYDAEIEYLGSSGTQYIQLSLSANAGQYFGVSGYMIPFKPTNSGGILGTSPYQQFDASYYSGSTSITYASSVGNKTASGGWGGTANVKTYFELSTEGKTSNGVFSSLSRPLTASINGFRIFSSYRSANSVKFCSFKITVGDSVVYDLIPVRIDSVGYMYDKVSDTLFGNAGTGSFTLGPDVAGWPGMEGTPKVSELRRQIFINSLKSSTALPYDAELEYLQTTTGIDLHIRLDISPNITTDACEIYFQQISNVTQGRFFAMGTKKLDIYINGSNCFAFDRYTGSDNWQQIYSTNVGTVKRKLKVDYLNKQVYVDDHLKYTITGTLVSPSSDAKGVYVFSSGNVAKTLNAKIFHVKYWSNGELIRDMIPVRKGNVAYMYDKITKKMYGNEGTGSFILGRDRYTKLSDYTLPDYIMSETSELDTRYVPNGNTRLVLDLWHRPITYDASYYAIFGARTGYKQNDFSFNIKKGESADFTSRDNYGNTETSPSCTRAVYERIVIDKNKGNTTIDYFYGSNLYSVTRTTQTFNSQYPMWIGVWNQNYTSYSAGQLRGSIFNCKIYDNDTPIRDYIPAIHPDGTVGFFDSIEKHFYPSDYSVPYRPGYIHTSNEGHKFIFFNTGVSDSLAYSRNNSDLLSSVIPIKTRRIKIKKDPTYTTTVIEYGSRTIIKKGGHTIISSDSTGDIIEVGPDCDHIALLIEGCPLTYDPQVDIIDIGDPNYLTFTALEDGTFTFTIGSTITTTQLAYVEYSVDGGTTWVKTNNANSTTKTITTPTITTGNKVLWRGIGLRTSNNNNNYTTLASVFSSTGQFDVSGNIMSLLYGADFAGKDYTSTGDSYTFRGLFYNATNLVHAHELCLPIFYLRSYCYRAMFYICRSLVSVPKLHSPKLASYCYSLMFAECTALTVVPNLPARYLANYCYSYMFAADSSIITIGNILPTMISLVSTYTFDHMFDRCSSLLDASALTINILNAQYAAQYMFSSCTSLVVPPTITATSVYSYGCLYMFSGCTSLVNAPSLPATTLGTYCYRYMYLNCTSLTNPPALPATTLLNYCYYNMFVGCKALVTAPALPCTGNIPDYAYAWMFLNCTSLINPPALPAGSVNTYGYSGMFSGCTNLATTPKLPALILGTYCYRAMFRNCKSLINSPKLIAPIIPTGGYKDMFVGCDNLNYIDCSAETINNTESTLEWTAAWDSTNLVNDSTQSGVASTGTFIQRAGVEWPTGVSGIPTGWTIIYLNPENGKYYTDSTCTTEWSNSPALPYTSKVEYLQNDGTNARIWTRLNYTNIDKYEVKFYYSTWVKYGKVFSNYQSGSYNTIGVELCSTDNDMIDTRFNIKNDNGGLTKVSAPKSQIHIVTGEKNVSITVDGVETAITNTTAGTANGNTIALFATNTTHTTTYATGMRIYYFKAWYNGVLMRNLIPVRVGTEGAMYDLASGELLENPMSGDFTLGSDIT